MSKNSKDDRPYDIIIYGASGYTGEITAEYIATHAKNKEKWAVAGRSKEKLQSLVSDLAKIDKSLASLPILTCDATKPDEIRNLVSQTRVLISCVGPYRIYGEDVVRACVEAGTDYIDVTGEPPFVNHVYEKYHAEAKQKQLYILPACGIGSLMPDVAVETIKEEFSKENTKTSQARGYLKMTGKYSKTFSNGTWGTLVNSLGNKEKRSSTQRSAPRKKSPKVGLHLFKPLNNWAYPFVEAADLHVIRRTNELTLNDAGNENFAYSQFVLFPLIPPLHVIIAILLVFLAHIFAAWSFTRKLLLKRKFADGGPTKEQRADARFDFWVYAQAESGERKTIHMQGPGAYDTTAICAAEAAFALVNDRSEIKPLYGVVTPAAVMNKQMLRRLPSGGISWQFE